MSVKKALGANIRKYRKERKYTLETLSERLEISIKHLNNIELGKDFTSARLLEAIATELKVPYSALFHVPQQYPATSIGRIVAEEMQTFEERVMERLPDMFTRDSRNDVE